jgi:hypothetical protein
VSKLVPIPTRTLVRAAIAVVTWPLFALLGAAVSARWLVRLVRRVARASHARHDTLRCPRGHANDVVGRWGCEECGAEYLGWVGACANCGDESVDWISCERCGLAIRLPWTSRS